MIHISSYGYPSSVYKWYFIPCFQPPNNTQAGAWSHGRGTDISPCLMALNEMSPAGLAASPVSPAGEEEPTAPSPRLSLQLLPSPGTLGHPEAQNGDGLGTAMWLMREWYRERSHWKSPLGWENTRNDCEHESSGCRAIWSDERSKIARGCGAKCTWKWTC